MPIQFHSLETRPTARYVSGTTVREEALDNSRLIGLYWSASGQVQRENVTINLPGQDARVLPIHVFELEIDGQRLHNSWEWVGASEREGARTCTREAVIELRHRVRPVTVKVITRLDGTSFMARYLEISNTGERLAALAHVSPWSGMLWNTNQHMGQLPPEAAGPFALGWVSADVHQGLEGNFVWETLQPGTRRIASNSGQCGYSNPFFILRNEVTGECAIGSLGWSGDWFAEFWYDPYVNMENQPIRGLNLSFTMGPAASAPQRVIEPGETVTTPETHLGILHAGFDECIAAWHEHLRTSVIPPRPKGKEFFTVAGRVVEETGDWILTEIDIAAEMGVDAFMVDAGWYGEEFTGWWDRRGDWMEGDWIPGGLAACRGRTKSHGMLFGLWMEPEGMTANSRLNREHPDWVMTSGDGRKAQMLDLSHPDAQQHYSSEVLRVIGEHKLDFFKQDYNEHVFEAGQRERGGFLEHEAWRRYETVYAAFDEVRRRFPEVALENCAGGGGRNDLGMMSRFHYCCESDLSEFPRSIRAINGLTLFLPPESLCYYHNHIWYAHQQADLDTHLRVTLFAQPVFVGFGAQDADRSTEYFEKTRRYIRLAKDFTGPIIAAKPRVYHHTPAIGVQQPADWCVLEYAAQDHSAGYVGVFRLSAPILRKDGRDTFDDYVLRPRGIDASRTYDVTLDNSGVTFTLSGADLMRTGLPIRLDGAFTSELVMYRQKG